MLLYHYSPNAVLTARNVRFSRSSPFKPEGLWLSDDSRECGWARWCVMEEFQMRKLRFRYPVSVDISGFLTIDAPEKAIEASDRYSRYHADNIGGKDYVYWEMDWKAVAEDYSGLLCSPYRKLPHDWSPDSGKHLWWSTIDCDCACVWERDAILSIGKPELTGIPVKEDFRDSLFRKS